ncbi:MAG: NAD-glutamate dehydrogenase domain-containing protein [Spirochaetota bacterium]
MKSLSEIQKKSYINLEDLVRLEEILLGTGYMTPEKARRVIDWFIVELGIDEYYYRTTSIDEIAKHLIAISASELVSRYGGEGVGIQLINERQDRAVYIVEDESSKTEEIEKRIESRYPMYRLESYRTKKKITDYYLRFYIVSKPRFQKGLDKKNKITFEDAANKGFMERSVPETIARYKEAWESMNHRESPYISITDKPETDETRVMVGIHGESSQELLVNFSHLLYKYNIYSNRKYREPFYDNKRINSFYFDKIDQDTMEDYSRDLNAVVMLPQQNTITGLFYQEVYSSQQTMYAISAAAFTHQFLTVMTEEYTVLTQALKDQPEAKGILDQLKMRLIKDTFSEARIAQAVIDHHEIVASIYEHFCRKLHPKKKQRDLEALEKEINQRIDMDVPSGKDKTILKYFLTFNNLILKTNFFMRDKTCMAYRLESTFLNKIDFPEEPYGVFFFVGREFIGFHVRFRDIARGGIRIVKSRNLTYYENNLDTIFLENYNLAATQQKKNKDIPEGGSKGTILLNLQNQDEQERAFKSYIDGVMDLVMPNEEVRDLHKENELLFLGPDEGTAELMNWAALYAKRRKYPFWKAFTTGKSPRIGGVPHDMYGMTTAGVHEYVLGVLEKLGMKEENVSKVQTGGPDGDLGSNEILSSKDRTIAVVDGSGVLYDPEGINREGLARLCRKRVMVENFDRLLLSEKGFLVTVNDKEVTLPDGTFVPNGEQFRNKFHLHPLARADLFLPCGGRPASVNINNWEELFDEKGTPRFRVIVEGANLFITEEARLRLEEHGIIVIKDASANKGGVTSSSLEVLACLAMSDQEFESHMMVKNDKISDFRKAYVREIINTIKNNARKEFNLLWDEHHKKNIPFTRLTNLISQKINDITDAVNNSDLVENHTLRHKVVSEYTPSALLELVGVDTLLDRVPANYLNAVVAARVATNFVYNYGLDADEVDFHRYISGLISKPEHSQVQSVQK